MSSFLNFLVEAKDVFGNAGIAFQAIASALAIMIWMPAILDVFRLNKTYGLSEKFLFFGVVVGVLFSINGIYTIIDNSGFTAIGDGTVNKTWIAFGSITLASNIFSGSCNFFFLGKKRLHMREAAALGISEMDYYNNHLAK